MILGFYFQAMADKNEVLKKSKTKFMTIFLLFTF